VNEKTRVTFPASLCNGLDDLVEAIPNLCTENTKTEYFATSLVQVKSAKFTNQNEGRFKYPKTFSWILSNLTESIICKTTCVHKTFEKTVKRHA
jgi:hypothetical protein